jgi:hypothetical protein
MEFLETHWHCIVPLIGVAAWLLCARKDSPNSENSDENQDWDSR